MNKSNVEMDIIQNLYSKKSEKSNMVFKASMRLSYHFCEKKSR